MKFRESFRPFAPSVLREHLEDWFELSADSPYMLLVAPVTPARRRPSAPKERTALGLEMLNQPRSEVPAVTHVDYSARIQTVHADTNPRYHALIGRFHELTGCPLVVNTSFNVRGEPIVCSPADAFRCFMATELDVLAIGNFLLFKSDQDRGPRSEYHSEYELD